VPRNQQSISSIYRPGFREEANRHPSHASDANPASSALILSGSVPAPRLPTLSFGC
jgi:hypothetical protein